MDFEVKPISEHFGAEITGLDLSKPLSDETFDKLRETFFDRGILVFRDQHIEPKHQVAFSSRFGELMIHVLDQFQYPGHKEILVLSNDKDDDGTPTGFEDAGRYWHSDLSYQKSPSLATMLYAIDIPPEGGDTMFVNMYRAYETLPDDIKERIEGKHAYHSYTRNYEKNESVRGLRPKLRDDQLATLEDVTHPIVRTVQSTGRKALYVNSGFTYQIVGMDEDESTEILEALFKHCRKAEFRYVHKWRFNDYVCWDNRSTIHHATPYDPTKRRYIHRTTIKDPLPVV